MKPANLALEGRSSDAMRLIKGHIRHDGMIFWSYACVKQGGRENWVTAETYSEKVLISRKAAAKYRNSDKGKARKKPQLSEKAKLAAKLRKQTEEWKAYARAYWSERRRTDTKLVSAIRLRTRLKHALNGKGWKKKNNTREIIGCSFEQLRDHIGSLFTAGMSWDNKHLWEIDHIIPLAKASNYEDLVRLSHYSIFTAVVGR